MGAQKEAGPVEGEKKGKGKTGASYRQLYFGRERERVVRKNKRNTCEKNGRDRDKVCVWHQERERDRE